MAKGTYADFFTALGKNESGNNYSFVSSLGYLGRFQFGEEALRAVGFYNDDGTWAIDFVGSWTQKAHSMGVYDKQGFLNSPAAQDAATTAWFEKIMDDASQLGLRQYEGQWIGGIQVSNSGLIAGAHLVGVWALKSFLESGGAVDTRDGYGTPVSEYVSRFGHFDTPFINGGSNPAPQPTPQPTPPPAPQPAPDGAGQVLTSDQYGDVLIGGNGGDTLNAGQGTDQLTGGGGADHFTFRQLPWNAGTITDFQDGVDKIDLRPILQAHGYWGSDPVADGYVRFESDWNGGVKVLLDTDGYGSGQSWPFTITTVKNVSPGALTVADLAGGAASSGGGGGQPSPPPAQSDQGQVLTSSRYGDVLIGGGGGDTLRAGQGPDQLTGGGGGDRFVFAQAPWNAGTITDFAPGSDKIDLTAIFDAAHYWGDNPQADGWMRLEDIGGSTRIHVDVDGPWHGQWPFVITTVQGVSPWSLSNSDFII